MSASAPARWSAYVRAIAGDVSQTTIARRCGIDTATVSRWLTGHTDLPQFATVLAFARSYGISPIDALVESGHLTEDDVELPSVDPRGVPTEVLVAELTRRANRAAISSVPA